MKVFVALVIWGCVAHGAAWALVDNPSETPALPASLVERLREQDFNDDAIARIFSDPRIELYPQILEKQGRGATCFSREPGFLGKQSIDRGRRVLSENYRLFKELESIYGVEKEAIVAIFRVETNFGKYTGSHFVFNSLFTIATLPNRRAEWAEKELVKFLVICRDEGMDPLSIKGSWAGAFGLSQFMPSSVLNYGVDGDKDGIVDLFNFTDAMASIANYLKQSGWENSDTALKKKAVFAYNHCDDYVKAVLAYAKAVAR